MHVSITVITELLFTINQKRIISYLIDFLFKTESIFDGNQWRRPLLFGRNTGFAKDDTPTSKVLVFDQLLCVFILFFGYFLKIFLETIQGYIVARRDHKTQPKSKSVFSVYLIFQIERKT